MTPEIRSAVKGAVQAMCASCVALGTSLAATSAHAQSAYACQPLETHAALPAIEGEAGTFFTVRPELQAFHSLGDPTIEHLAKLTQALAARDVTLVMMPVPTRAQVLSHLLPPMAAYLGFDADTSTAVHQEMIARLNEAGVNVADARADLRRASLDGTSPFFGVDHRPTSEGAQILAQSVGRLLNADPDLKDAARVPFVSVPSDIIALPSIMRTQLQTACEAELPTPRVQTHVTAQAGEASADRLVVVGTEITATDALNLAGFLSEATGLDAVGYGVPGGGAFAAISSYLTSLDFQAAPPRVLVWEWPVTAPLADKGDQPMRELIAAAGTTCTTTLPMTDGNADLSGLNANAETTLALDTGGTALPFVRFHFTDTRGLVRTRSIYRHPGQLLTGRFYVPFTGLDTQTLASVEIETPTALRAQPRLSACQ